MDGSNPIDGLVPAGDSAQFPTTHWSVVLAAGDSGSWRSARALEALCQAYWSPLYAYVRWRGHSQEDAQDLTQEFFARFLEHKYIKHADPECGRFRTFLLTSLNRFLVSEWRKAGRQKRGGGQKPITWDTEAAEQAYAAEVPMGLTPEKTYEKRWATTLMERVLARLREEYAAADKARLFEELKDCVWGDDGSKSYAQLAAEWGLPEGTVKANVHRLRGRCREVLRLEIAQTVARPEDIDDELRHLIEVFSA